MVQHTSLNRSLVVSAFTTYTVLLDFEEHESCTARYLTLPASTQSPPRQCTPVISPFLSAHHTTSRGHPDIQGGIYVVERVARCQGIKKEEGEARSIARPKADKPRSVATVYVEAQHVILVILVNEIDMPGSAAVA